MEKCPQSYIFDAQTLSDAQHTRLNDLLTVLERAVREKDEYVTQSRLKALEHWFSNNYAGGLLSDFYKVYHAVPTQKWPQVFEETLMIFDELPEAETYIKLLRQMPVDKQVQATAYIMGQYTNFMNPIENERYCEALAQLYEQILQEFPNILLSENDLQAALDLGRGMKGAGIDLKEAWDKATQQDKVQKVQEIIATAHPEEEIEKLHIGVVDALHDFDAAVLPVANGDIMMCGGNFFEGIAYEFLMFVVAHELQHRRQMRLVAALRSEMLEKGTTAYYQARFFQANLYGGYLRGDARVPRAYEMAQRARYIRQPVEQQANYSAAIVSKAAGNNQSFVQGVEVPFDIDEKTQTIRPVHYCRRVMSRIARAGQRALGL